MTPEKLLVHKDYPKWIRSKTEKVEVVTAKCEAGKLAWVLIDQAHFHGIPSGGSCVGWFLSAVSPDGFEQYLEKLENHLRRLRNGELKHVNHDPEGHQEGFSALDAIILDFCKGSRTHLYESGKTVQGPHSMASNKFDSRQHRYFTNDAFAHVRGKQSKCDSVEAILERLKKRGMAKVFQNAAKTETWNVDPSSFSDESLLRFFGAVPDLTGGRTQSVGKRKRSDDDGGSAV
uniref:Uncharacterized protein n=1 Tax=Pseudictyota dubia TaxID=2749911 RepID=A0A7R9ZEY7_9STRA|mmetsp:Transcript_47226/g.87745  ORF Transcript_47226/g.87745 Transcript_47226/m.87745 type:complete len:232 (+) Transcript_47226:1-696(+)